MASGTNSRSLQEYSVVRLLYAILVTPEIAGSYPFMEDYITMNKATRTFSLMTLMIISASLLASASVLAAKPKKPNIVFILVDDLGWTDIASWRNRA